MSIPQLGNFLTGFTPLTEKNLLIELKKNLADSIGFLGSNYPEPFNSNSVGVSVGVGDGVSDGVGDGISDGVGDGISDGVGDGVSISVGVGDCEYSEHEHEFESKCRTMITTCSEYFFKIISMLELLHIVGENQTNKFKYEECFGFTGFMDLFVKTQYNFLLEPYSQRIQQIQDLSKLGDKTDAEIISKYKTNVELKQKIICEERVNSLTSMINMYILQLTKISIIVKKINVY